MVRPYRQMLSYWWMQRNHTLANEIMRLSEHHQLSPEAILRLWIQPKVADSGLQAVLDKTPLGQSQRTNRSAKQWAPAIDRLKQLEARGWHFELTRTGDYKRGLFVEPNKKTIFIGVGFPTGNAAENQRHLEFFLKEVEAIAIEPPKQELVVPDSYNPNAEQAQTPSLDFGLVSAEKFEKLRSQLARYQIFLGTEDQQNLQLQLTRMTSANTTLSDQMIERVISRLSTARDFADIERDLFSTYQEFAPPDTPGIGPTAETPTGGVLWGLPKSNHGSPVVLNYVVKPQNYFAHLKNQGEMRIGGPCGEVLALNVDNYQWIALPGLATPFLQRFQSMNRPFVVQAPGFAPTEISASEMREATLQALGQFASDRGSNERDFRNLLFLHFAQGIPLAFVPFMDSALSLQKIKALLPEMKNFLKTLGIQGELELESEPNSPGSARYQMAVLAVKEKKKHEHLLQGDEYLKFKSHLIPIDERIPEIVNYLTRKHKLKPDPVEQRLLTAMVTETLLHDSPISFIEDIAIDDGIPVGDPSEISEVRKGLSRLFQSLGVTNGYQLWNKILQGSYQTLHAGELFQTPELKNVVDELDEFEFADIKQDYKNHHGIDIDARIVMTVALTQVGMSKAKRTELIDNLNQALQNFLFEGERPRDTLLADLLDQVLAYQPPIRQDEFARQVLFPLVYPKLYKGIFSSS